MTADDLLDRELLGSQFQRLVRELVRGSITRNAFQRWELEILIDFDACALDAKQRDRILRQYERSVGRELAKGSGPPMKLSDFIQLRRTRRPSTE